MFSPTITTFANLAPPWSLPTLDANFSAINAMLANAASWAAATGAADVITAAYAPVNTALTDGLLLGVRALAANATTTPTFSPDGLTAHTITKVGGSALAAGDIPAALAEMLLRYNLANTRWELLNPQPVAATSVSVPVRQTVLNGPVDSSGFPNFGGSTGSGTVTQTGTLIVTAANGFTLAAGAVNRIGSGANLSWTGLTTNGTMYLYVLVNADGTLTTGSTTTAPVYQWGGSFSNTNGAFVFNIQTMTGNLGTGAANAQAYLTFVGEVTVAGAVVTVITWYQLLGRYDSGFTATLPSAGVAVSKNHNLGVTPRDFWLIIENTSPDNGYVVGDQVQVGQTNASANMQPPVVRARMTIGVVAGSAGAWIGSIKSTGAFFTLTLASWQYKFLAKRGW